MSANYTSTGHIVVLSVEGSGVAQAEMVLNYVIPHTDLTAALGMAQDVVPVAFLLTERALWNFSAPDGVVTCRSINLAAPWAATSAPITHVLLCPGQDHLATALIDAGWLVGRANEFAQQLHAEGSA